MVKSPNKSDELFMVLDIGSAEKLILPIDKGLDLIKIYSETSILSGWREENYKIREDPDDIHIKFMRASKIAEYITVSRLLQEE